MHRRLRAPLTAALLCGALLSACGTAAPTPSPTPQPTASPSPTPTPSPDPTPSPTPTPVPTPTPIPLDQSLLVRRVTVLVIGNDGNDIRHAIRGFIENTDALLVVSIDARHEQITMLSLPRDTVDVPMADGRTWSAKINSLRGALGYDALEGALETLYGIPIDYYVEIDMADFGRLVNAVGGVDVVNPYALYDPAIGLNLPAGPAHLNGNGAARYVRTRVDLDYSRARRQQQVFLAMVEKFVDPALELDALAFLSGLRSLRTDIPLDKLPTFMELARRARDATVVGQVMAPPRFALFEGFAASRGWIMTPNVAEIRAFVRSAIVD
jgi:LCP family protein required for cell wall assembly